MYLAAMTNLCHFRGHGIHSPFAYNLVRECLIPRHFVCSHASTDKPSGAGGLRSMPFGASVYDAMRTMGMTKKASRQLQNIFYYLRASDFKVLESAESVASNSKTLYFTAPQATNEDLEEIVVAVKAAGGAVVIIYPRTSLQRMKLCRRLCRSEDLLSIDNRRFLLLIFDEKLPNQHYKL